MLKRPKQVAKETGLGYGYVLSLMKSGKLTPVHLPDRTFPMVDQADVDRLLCEAKSGTDGGTKLPNDSETEQARRAPKKRCRERISTGQFAGKPKWVKEFSRVR